ncbi:uncharacterized protein LOC113294562 [Papaver somniferum]|uniref:uncharacterized protein LOC113294562 n=1 Tax=Papaver somniferum TaxID=3469 RepID=UPI000E6FBE40|nr:uncharacterized protein LOC113294562 [Papaver somniferum]
MKKHIWNIISPMQAAYVPGRSISENILLFNKWFILHSMKRQSGRVGSMTLKMDMSKEFDRIEWDFLFQVLKKFGFCDKQCHLIHQCISTSQVEMIVCFSLKQNLDQTRTLLQVIEEFSKCSGQVINFNKSSVYFSNNISLSSSETLAGILQVPIMDPKEKYLVLHFFNGRNKKVPFSVLVEKMESRLSKWNAYNLSEPRRIVMVKHVLNAIPVHHMIYFKFPDQTIKDLNSLQGKFWRRKDSNKGAIISWKNLSKDT